ncbi:MAG TPA: hypothetical protein VF756_18245 [Thermoanaerobaculia bacterium]
MIRRLPILILSLLLLTSSAALANQAALVIDLGNRVITECVEFEGPVTTAFELLELSGLNFTFQEFNFGAAICSIQATGCQFPQESCFCQCTATSPSCLFFSLFFLRRGEFVSSNVSASHLIVHSGDVIAFSFGGGTAPEVVTFEEVCGTQ